MLVNLKNNSRTITFEKGSSARMPKGKFPWEENLYDGEILSMGSRGGRNGSGETNKNKVNRIMKKTINTSRGVKEVNEASLLNL